jgi:hypothetical protein
MDNRGMEVPMQFNFKRILAGLIFASMLGCVSVPAQAGFLDVFDFFWKKNTEEKEQTVTSFVKNSSETGKLLLAGGALALVYTAFRALSKDKAKPSTMLFGLLALLGFTGDAAAQRMNEDKKEVENILGIDAAKDIVTEVAQKTQEANKLASGFGKFVKNVKNFVNDIAVRLGFEDAAPAPAPQPAPQPQPAPAPQNNNNNNNNQQAPAKVQGPWTNANLLVLNRNVTEFEQTAQTIKKSIDDFLDTKNNEKFKVHIARMGQSIDQMKKRFTFDWLQRFPNSTFKDTMQAVDTVGKTMIKMIDDLYIPLSKKDTVAVTGLENVIREQEKKLDEAVKKLLALLMQNGQQPLADRVIKAHELLKQNELQKIMAGPMAMFILLPILGHRFSR